MEKISVTHFLIFVNVIVSFYAFSRAPLMQAWIFNPYMIHRKRQYFRFITSGFIHNNHLHLIWNMIALYFFGANVEMTFELLFGTMGLPYYLIFYLTAIIVSDIPTYFKYRHNPGYNALGASGGVSAIVFASILFYPLHNIYLFFVLPIPGFILGAIFLIWSYQQGRHKGDHINHDAHLFGGLYGLLFCAVMSPEAYPAFLEQLIQWEPFEDI